MAGPNSIAIQILKSVQNITRTPMRHLQLTHPIANSSKVNLFDLNFDRRIKKDYRESIKYMESDTYKRIYQGHLVWKLFRRNFRGTVPRHQSKHNCINQEGFLDSSYPCPICRDEYLVLHHENTKLIEQFIDPNTGRIFGIRDHHLCLKQYRNLIIAIDKAKDLGTLTFVVPERLYNYEDYYGELAAHTY